LPDNDSISRGETMTHSPIRLLAAVLLGALALPLAAAPRLELEGRLAQGSVVFGRTDPGASVYFADREVRVSPEGVFVIGFGRDAKSTEGLVVEGPDGKRIERSLEIARRDYDIQRIDGVPPETVSPPEEAWERIREEVELVREARRRDDPRTEFLSGFIWPMSGRITGVYGSQRVYNGEPRRPHYGIDIAAAAGTEVRAPAGGIVTVAHEDMYFSGGTLLLDHGHGLSSAFLHLQSLAVDVGERVAQGDTIGTVGAGGRSTGAHLDWRINWFQRRLDPRQFVGPMPERGN
jgi:murein DD-endopeptidase MepM/ murein hydrolase activator NlpD